MAEGLEGEQTYGLSSEGKTGECTPGRANRNDALEGTLSPVYIHEGNWSCESLQSMNKCTT